MTSLAIFGDASQVYRTMSTLERLVRLDNALPKSRMRHQVLEKLSTMGHQFEKQKAGPSPLPLDEARVSLLAQLKETDSKFRSCNVSSVYGAEIEKAQNDAQLAEYVLRILRDAKSIQIEPLKKSHRGDYGPTFLVSYTRPDSSFKTSTLHQYVLKWSDREVPSNLLYKAFAQKFKFEGKSYTYSVPQTAMIDLENGIHEDSSSETTLLSPDETEKMTKKFQDLVHAVDPKIEPKDTQVMLMEKISGADLFDFALRKYADLSPAQKAKLFSRIGKLTLLDLVLGNIDRFIQVDPTGKSYEIASEGSNLGNALIVWSGDESEMPAIVAIDNGIRPNLIENDEDKKAYLHFLKTLLAEADLPALLAAKTAQAISTALFTLCDDEERVDVAHAALQNIRKDLDENGMARPAISRGIDKMMQRLHKIVLPLWNSEQSQPLKDHLSWAYPELLHAVKERLELFKSTRR